MLRLQQAVGSLVYLLLERAFLVDSRELSRDVSFLDLP